MVVAPIVAFEGVCSCGREQLDNEFDLALNTWLFVMDVAAFDCSDGFDPAQGRLG